MGEAFDKVGKRFGLPFPQGPRVDELAERGDPVASPFPVPDCGASLDFSYSGLKSQAIQAIARLERAGVRWAPEQEEEPPQPALDLLAGFRAAAVGQALDRLERLQAREPIPLLAVSGGAAANRLLRRELVRWAAERGVELRLVPLVYSGDNAAMIGHAALLRHRRGLTDDPLAAEAESRIAI